MKNLIQYISIGFLCFIAFSCSNDFLKDGSDLSINADMTIYIAPEWGAADYSVHVPMAGNAKFSVIQSPDWLQVNTPSGQFTNDYASINCSASTCKDYSEIGIYNASIILEIEGKGKSLVPISYITEGNPVIETAANVELRYDSYSSSNGHAALVIRNTGEGILLWGISEKPEWITINFPGGTMIPDHTLYLLPQQSDITLELSYNNTSIPTSDLQGKIIIASNDKNHSETEVNVSFNMGNPSLYCNTNQLDFGRTETGQSLWFSNYGSGLLTWEIDSCPEWLSVSKTSGALTPYSDQYLTFTCNRSLVPNGQQPVTIYLKTNDKDNPSYAITVTIINYAANPENIRAINGTVTDAWADKNNNILYIATSQPNRLLAYNMKTKTIDKELTLSKAPTCFSVSEDGHKAIVGHSGLISSVNMDNFSVTKTLEVNYNIFDIEWGSGNWCCYTGPGDLQWSRLYWINLDTNETSNLSASLYGGSILRKIPGQNYIVASEINLSNGVHIYNSNSREEEYDFFTYFGNFWFSETGTYLFSEKNIYRTSQLFSTPEYSDDLPPIGNFSPVPYQTYWIDHSAASHSVWVLSRASDYYFDTQREIRQYEDNDYTQVNTYYYDDYYNGYLTQAQYVFANGTGDEVIVIKNIVSDNNDRNDWSIEHIPVIK
ncbi:MAG: hypothetical protein FWF53_08935 [Candidatus Azobacteroides sp.]|nr:hypothetical protein [Candidatus Azobacteroides sp.]